MYSGALSSSTYAPQIYTPAIIPPALPIISSAGYPPVFNNKTAAYITPIPVNRDDLTFNFYPSSVTHFPMPHDFCNTQLNNPAYWQYQQQQFYGNENLPNQVLIIF